MELVRPSCIGQIRHVVQWIHVVRGGFADWTFGSTTRRSGTSSSHGAARYARHSDMLWSEGIQRGGGSEGTSSDSVAILPNVFLFQKRDKEPAACSWTNHIGGIGREVGSGKVPGPGHSCCCILSVKICAFATFISFDRCCHIPGLVRFISSKFIAVKRSPLEYRRNLTGQSWLHDLVGLAGGTFLKIMMMEL
jgi:hypothetical protein